MRRLPILMALLGLLLAAVLVAQADAAQVLRAVESVGWDGFALLLLWQGALFPVLAAAWRSVLPGGPYPVLLWGRMVRDGATTCLPFSPLGGFVLGARATTLVGLPWPTAAASTVVDVAAEVAAQALFALFGTLVILLRRPGGGSATAFALAAGLAAAVLGLAMLFHYRRRLAGLVRALGERLAGGLFADAAARLDRLQAELARLGSNPGRFAVAVGFHLLGWLGTGGATWAALHLLGHPVDLPTALAVEAAVHALVGVAFLVPGGAGVQEAGYAGIGALFGIPPDLALGLSLLRRAREAAWGLPVLLAWQGWELRRMRAAATR